MQSNNAPSSTSDTVLSYLQPILSLFSKSQESKSEEKKPLDTVEIKIETAKPSTKLKTLRTLPPKVSTKLIPDQKYKKTSRSRTEYTSNKTAGISLSKTIKPEKPGIVSTSQTYLNSLISVFYSATPAPAKEEIKAPTCAAAPIVNAAPNSSYLNSAYSILSGLASYLPQPAPPESTLTQMEKLQDESNKLYDEVSLKRVEIVADEIKEHAALRVDLFFYLLLAVYKKQIIVSKDSTLKQHGKGSEKAGTHACHSSLFPNPKFTSIDPDQECPSLAGKRFEDTLNMTTELPTVVNGFDGELEGGYKQSKQIQDCLTILNKASQDHITPEEGMNEFIGVMNQFFNEYDKGTKTPKTNLKIWEYQKEGTFMSISQDKKTMCEHYFHSKLELNASERAQVKKDPSKLNNYYQAIQDRLLETKPEKGVRRRLK